MPMARLHCRRTPPKARWCSCARRRKATSPCCKATLPAARPPLWLSTGELGAFRPHAAHGSGLLPEGFGQTALRLIVELRCLGGASLTGEQAGEIHSGEREHGVIGGKGGLLNLQGAAEV